MPLAICFGVHSSPTGLAGLAIRTVTEARCQSPWVLGPSHPATHAYVTWTHGDGIHYRVDAQPHGARISVWPGPWEFPLPGTPPAAHWQFIGPDEDVKRAISKAVSSVGAPYDFIEIAAQAIPGPLGALVGTSEGVQGAVICTHLTADVICELGAPAKILVAGLLDRVPERLARRLEQVATGGAGWLVRVP